MDRNTSLMVVEDDESAVALLRHAFEAAGIACPVHFCEDGNEAIAYLNLQAKAEQAHLPRVVLMDVKLPTWSGHDVLLWVKGNALFKGIPIVIYSSSNDPSDITRAYSIGAACYLVKPASFKRLVEMAKALKLLWLDGDGS